MYWEIAGTDERVPAIPSVRDRRVRATKVRLYLVLILEKNFWVFCHSERLENIYNFALKDFVYLCIIQNFNFDCIFSL